MHSVVRFPFRVPFKGPSRRWRCCANQDCYTGTTSVATDRLPHFRPRHARLPPQQIPRPGGVRAQPAFRLQGRLRVRPGEPHRGSRRKDLRAHALRRRPAHRRGEQRAPGRASVRRGDYCAGDRARCSSCTGSRSTASCSRSCAPRSPRRFVPRMPTSPSARPDAAWSSRCSSATASSPRPR